MRARGCASGFGIGHVTLQVERGVPEDCGDCGPGHG
jgi:hypothetical protein